MKYDTKLQYAKNTKKRDQVTDYLLNSLDWNEGGTYSTSACFRGEQQKNRYKMSWGMRYNVSGSRAKYFTAYKYFNTKKQAKKELNKIIKKYKLNGVLENFKCHTCGSEIEESEIIYRKNRLGNMQYHGCIKCPDYIFDQI